MMPVVICLITVLVLISPFLAVAVDIGTNTTIADIISKVVNGTDRQHQHGERLQ